MSLLATFIALAAATSATPDWRFVTTNGEGSGALFVDLASIAITPDNHRDAEVLLVFKADKADGVAAVRARLQVDCTNHRQRNVHVWTVDASNKAMADGDISEDWSAILPGTAAVPMEGYVCAAPAERKDSVSLGATVPIGKVRDILNRPKTK